MSPEHEAIDNERAAERELREHRPRLVACLRAGGFPAMAAWVTSMASAFAEEEPREYVGDPEPAGIAPRPLQTMAFSDGGLNLFRPSPMPGAQVEQAQPSALPAHAATEDPAAAGPADGGDGAARAVLRQRGIHNPTEEQIQTVLAVAPWLVTQRVDVPLFVDSTTPDATTAQ